MCVLSKLAQVLLDVTAPWRVKERIVLSTKFVVEDKISGSLVLVLYSKLNELYEWTSLLRRIFSLVEESRIHPDNFYIQTTATWLFYWRDKEESSAYHLIGFLESAKPCPLIHSSLSLCLDWRRGSSRNV